MNTSNMKKSITICLVVAVLFMATGQGFGANYGVWAENGQIATISGGSVHGDIIGAYAYGGSQITINGGDVSGGIWGALAQHDSQITINGGDVSGSSRGGSAVAQYDSQITINGGSLSGMVLAQSGSQIIINGGFLSGTVLAQSALITIYGSNFAINGNHVEFGTVATSGGTLTGTLANGDIINTRVWGDSIVLIPEPATLSLVALGGLAMMRTRRQFSQ